MLKHIHPFATPPCFLRSLFLKSQGKFFQIFRVASLRFSSATSSHYERMIPQLSGAVDYQNSTINLVWPSKH